MAHPQMEAIGVTNVFGDVSDRVFEVSTEELLDRNPDLVVVLYGDEMDPVAIEQSLRALSGADALTALTDDQILMQPFQYTDPPNPLSVTGLELMAERFGRP